MHTELHQDYRDTREGQQAKAILGACVHCGFCLATCPTYLDLRDERDSPRGRIYLIKQLLEGEPVTGNTRTHLDRCLTCRSCETTCPSGVQYGRLVDIGRGIIEQKLKRPRHEQFIRWSLRKLLVQTWLFRILLRTGQFFRPVLPRLLRAKIPTYQNPGKLPATRHTRFMLVLEGCIQSAATPQTNAAAARVLDKLGIELRFIAKAGCCGAVSYHLGAQTDGLDYMRRNIDAWWPSIEAGAECIISTASGCGAMLAEYGELLAHDPAYADKAARVTALLKDIGEVLKNEDLVALQLNTAIGKVAVHTPCTLQHALKQPELVTTILRNAGFDLAATTEAHLCCGSAGTYSILQPVISKRLLENKLQALNIDQPTLIVTANIGCQLQLAGGADIPVRHWIELLDPAVDGS